MILYMGVDAGGTSTRMLAQTPNGPPDLHLHDGGANLLRHGETHVATRIAALVRQVQASRPEATPGALVAGVAGAGQIDAQQSLAARIREELGNAAPPIVQIVHDGVVSLETAFPADSGMLIIAGTGSALLARSRKGILSRAGGWGYLIGDEGSGHTIGKKGIAAVAHELDGGPRTTLTHRLGKRHGIEGRQALLQAIFVEQWPVQTMAPIVLEAATEGDAVAQRIVKSEVAALAQQALWLYRRASDIKHRICLTGGMSQSRHYRTAFTCALNTVLPDFTLSRTERPSTYGAARLAQQLAKNRLRPADLRVTDSGDGR